jgi:hypothetical protein
VKDKIAEWRALADQASPGPWLFNGRYLRFDTAQFANDKTIYDDVSWQAIDVPLPEYGELEEPQTRRALADGRFIVAAREAVPALLAEVDRLRIANEAQDVLERAYRAAYVVAADAKRAADTAIAVWLTDAGSAVHQQERVAAGRAVEVAEKMLAEAAHNLLAYIRAEKP